MNILELAVIVSAVDKATSVLRGVQGALTGTAVAGEKMKAIGQSAAMAGAAMTAAGGQIIGGLESMVAPANEVQEALAKVESVMTPLEGTMTDALGRVEQAAWDWSAAHKGQAADFVDTTYMMISAGLNEKAAIAGTQAAMLTATATMGDATDAANLLGGVYNTMGDKTADVTTEMMRLGDIVTKTQQTFQFANMAQLNEGLKFAIPAALQTSTSFEQLNTAIGHLNSNQLQGSMAGTALAQTLANMSKASKDLNFDVAKTADGGLDLIGTIGNIEKKFGSLKDMTPEVQAGFRTAFTDEGWRAVSLMIGKSDELRMNLDKVTNSAGAAATAAAVLEKTNTSQWAILGNLWDRLKALAASGLQPAFEAIVPLLTEGVGALTSWVKANPGLTRMVVLLAGILGVVLSIGGPILMAVGALGMFGGSVLTGFAMLGTALTAVTGALSGAAVAAGGFAAALLANPITWIVLAIVAAAALIYIYWEPIKAFFTGLWDELKAAFNRGWVNGIVRVLMYFSPVYWIARGLNALSQYLFGFSLKEGAVKLLNTILEGLQATWQSVIDAFDQGFFGGLMRLFELFSPISWIASGLNALSSWLLGYSLGDAGAKLWQSLSEGASAIWADIVGGFDGGVLAGIWNLLSNWSPLALMVKAWDSVVQWLFGFSLAEAGTAIIDTLMSGLSAVWGNIVGGFKAGPLQGLLNLVANFSLLGALARVLDAVTEEVFGFSLFEPGMAILRDLAAGIESAAGAVWADIVAGFDGGVLAGIWNLLSNWSPLALLVQAWDAVMQWLWGISLIDAGASVLQSLLTGMAGVWDNIVAGFQQGPLQGLLNLVLSFSLVAAVGGVIDAVTQYLFGFSLFEPGMNILKTLAAGIEAAAAVPVNAVKSVVQKVRNLLPFSPAKEGPLADLDRVRLIETVASAVRPAPLIAAVTNATGAAMAVMPGGAGAPPMPQLQPMAIPAMMPMPAPSPRAADSTKGGVASGGAMAVHIHIEGNADPGVVDRLEQWARDNADMLSRLVEQQAQVEARGAF